MPKIDYQLSPAPEMKIIRPHEDVVEAIRQMLAIQQRMLDLLQPIVQMRTIEPAKPLEPRYRRSEIQI